MRTARGAVSAIDARLVARGRSALTCDGPFSDRPLAPSRVELIKDTAAGSVSSHLAAGFQRRPAPKMHARTVKNTRASRRIARADFVKRPSLLRTRQRVLVKRDRISRVFRFPICTATQIAVRTRLETVVHCDGSVRLAFIADRATAFNV